MEVVVGPALVALFLLVSGVRRARRRAFAVRHYEHAYSAIDAAVTRARTTDTAIDRAGDGQGHVLIVEPAARRRDDVVVPLPGADRLPTAGAAGSAARHAGVPSPLAG